MFLIKEYVLSLKENNVCVVCMGVGACGCVCWCVMSVCGWVCLVRPCIGIKKYPCCKSFSFICMYNNILCKLLVGEYDK